MKATLDEGHELMANLDYVYPTDIPVPIDAEVGLTANDVIVITFDQVLNDTTLPAITSFTITGAYLNAQVAVVAIVGDQVFLTLDNDARCDNTITVDYDVPGNDGIRNTHDTYAEAFNDLAVTNNIAVGYDDEPLVLVDGTAYLLVQNQLALSLKNAVEIETWYYFANTFPAAQSLFEVQNNANNWLKLSINSGTQNLGCTGKCNGVNFSTTWVGFFNVVPTWYQIKITWSGTTFRIYRNNILYDTQVYPNLLTMVQDAGCDLYLFNDSVGLIVRPINMMFGFKYTTNSAQIVRYPICEELGNTVYNVVSNAYHLTGQAGFNGLSWIRGNDQEKYLRDYGYRYTGVYIPGLLSGTSAADGNPLTEWSPCTEFN